MQNNRKTKVDFWDKVIKSLTFADVLIFFLLCVTIPHTSGIMYNFENGDNAYRWAMAIFYAVVIDLAIAYAGMIASDIRQEKVSRAIFTAILLFTTGASAALNVVHYNGKNGGDLATLSLGLFLPILILMLAIGKSRIIANRLSHEHPEEYTDIRDITIVMERRFHDMLLSVDTKIAQISQANQESIKGLKLEFEVWLNATNEQAALLRGSVDSIVTQVSDIKLLGSGISIKQVEEMVRNGTITPTEAIEQYQMDKSRAYNLARNKGA